MNNYYFEPEFCEMSVSAGAATNINICDLYLLCGVCDQVTGPSV